MTQHKHLEGKGKPLKVVAPEGCQSHLTEGMHYEVIGFWEKYESNLGHRFIIHDDYGEAANCIENHCGHLSWGKWIVTEREPS